MSRRRAGVHDPHAAILRIVRQSHRLRRRTGNGDRHMGARGGLVLAHQVIPDRSEFRLGSRAVFFSRIESGLPLRAVRLRFELHVLRGPVEVSKAGALERVGQLSRQPRLVKADQTIGALPQRVVRPVGLPLDDRRLVAEVGGSREQRLVYVGLRRPGLSGGGGGGAPRPSCAPATPAEMVMTANASNAIRFMVRPSRSFLALCELPVCRRA